MWIQSPSVSPETHGYQMVLSTVCSRCQFHAVSHRHSTSISIADVRPGSHWVGRGGITTSSGGGKYLSRAQCEYADLWLMTEVLLIFSRFAENFALWMKARVLVCVSFFFFFFPTKPNVKIQSIPWSKYHGTKLRIFTVVFPARNAPL